MKKQKKEAEEPVNNAFAVCSVCGRHTEKADIPTAINQWNKGEVK